jgi:hypothetical protein
MDEKDDAKLINMMWETKAFMHKQQKSMGDLAELLLKERSPNRSPVKSN